MKKIFIALLCVIVVFLSFFTTVFADEPYNGVLQYLPMTYNPDSVRLMNNSWLDGANGWPILDSTLISDGENTYGINGSPALIVQYTDSSITDNLQKGDRVLMSSSNNRWENTKYSHEQTAGYVYFQSAMMKLDREAGFWIYGSFQHTHSGTINGFNVAATDYAAEKAKYDALGADEKTIMSNYAMTGGMELSTSWYRYNTAYYIDTMINDAGSPVDSISGTLRVATGIAAGTRTGITPETPLGVLIDDYVMIKVPANNITAEVYPMAGNIDITGEANVGGTLTANANAYDVNPMVTPSVAYQWQISADGEEYTDIPGATGASYAVQSGDLGGKYIRVSVAVSSTRADGTVKTHNAQSVPVVTGNAAAAPAVDSLSVTSSDDENVIPGSVLTANAVVSNGTATYQWQVKSENESEFAAITGASSASFTVTEELVGKYIRVKVTPVSDDTSGEPVFSVADLVGSGKPMIFADEKEIETTYSYSHAEYTDGKPVFSAISYAVIKGGSVQNVKEYGFVLKNADGYELYLPCTGIVWSAENSFAVRVFGKVFETSGVYTVTPYIKYADDSYFYGQSKEFSVK